VPAAGASSFPNWAAAGVVIPYQPSLLKGDPNPHGQRRYRCIIANGAALLALRVH
jgi:hypothetical protein